MIKISKLVAVILKITILLTKELYCKQLFSVLESLLYNLYSYLIRVKYTINLYISILAKECCAILP